MQSFSFARPRGSGEWLHSNVKILTTTGLYAKKCLWGSILYYMYFIIIKQQQTKKQTNKIKLNWGTNSWIEFCWLVVWIPRSAVCEASPELGVRRGDLSWEGAALGGAVEGGGRSSLPFAFLETLPSSMTSREKLIVKVSIYVFHSKYWHCPGQGTTVSSKISGDQRGLSFLGYKGWSY